MNEPADQGLPNRSRGKRAVHWRRDPIILARLQEVERRHLAGQTNIAVAESLGVDETTIRRDLGRLNELWLERTTGEQETLRARAVRELDEIKRRALDAADFDAACERAVLFDEIDPDVLGDAFRVSRDDKGSAQFRGNKAAALNVARQAIMDTAKVLGIVVDKQETKHDTTDAFIQALREFGRAQQTS